MHEVLGNHLGGLSLPRKSVARLTDRPNMTLDVYHGQKTTTQQQVRESPTGLLLDFLTHALNNLLHTIIGDLMSKTILFYLFFSSPGQSPGRAIVEPPVSAFALALAKC